MWKGQEGQRVTGRGSNPQINRESPGGVRGRGGGELVGKRDAEFWKAQLRAEGWAPGRPSPQKCLASAAGHVEREEVPARLVHLKTTTQQQGGFGGGMFGRATGFGCGPSGLVSARQVHSKPTTGQALTETGGNGAGRTPTPAFTGFGGGTVTGGNGTGRTRTPAFTGFGGGTVTGGNGGDTTPTRVPNTMGRDSVTITNKYMTVLMRAEELSMEIPAIIRREAYASKEVRGGRGMELPSGASWMNMQWEEGDVDASLKASATGRFPDSIYSPGGATAKSIKSHVRGHVAQKGLQGLSMTGHTTRQPPSIKSHVRGHVAQKGLQGLSMTGHTTRQPPPLDARQMLSSDELSGRLLSGKSLENPLCGSEYSYRSYALFNKQVEGMNGTEFNTTIRSSDAHQMLSSDELSGRLLSKESLENPLCGSEYSYRSHALFNKQVEGMNGTEFNTTIRSSGLGCFMEEHPSRDSLGIGETYEVYPLCSLCPVRRCPGGFAGCQSPACEVTTVKKRQSRSQA
uniref:Uncharacterized protein n=1 Tax=Chromera velia CCMP2878 TaxID=1169474 RepID=A0A0G4G356_9ALVE|eukprot:Cvel_20047.t1-p1 / transcript=Cvel_20047.t1 / gene=Cvel_20047 / organism=Chromera_velia_CCMP2878 / gene_product=hypothetical protein / transcript_product=hypothetical protein / location=Cvel_scaffold1772:6825-15851(+) / protein_length=513 / sequence_SO=supercontig / SO=protein_coding / is_pseudo=false